MKKLFVILLTICIFLLPGCKPALPSTTIYISNETGSKPDSYELEILFNDSKNPNARAFHMKNIGSEIETNSRAIVLENMPKTLYVAHVNAYDVNGNKVGTGEKPFQAGFDDAVYVTVEHWEKPYALYTKAFTFTPGLIDNIELHVYDVNGSEIYSNTYNGMTGRTSFQVPDIKLRTESISASFEWKLQKGSTTIAICTDYIDKIMENSKAVELRAETLNYGISIKDATYDSHDFNSITLEVVPAPELRNKIGKFDFVIQNPDNDEIIARIPRPIREDNLYFIDECVEDSYKVTATPITTEGERLNELARTIEAETNIPLESVTFTDISIQKPIKLRLGLDTLTFNLEKNPDIYTKWEEPGLMETSSNIVDVSLDGNKVTVVPKTISDSIATLSYAEPYQTELTSEKLDVQVILAKPTLNITTAGSYITIYWSDIYSQSELYLITKVNDDKPKTTQIKNLAKPIETIFPKQTKVTFQLMVKYEDHKEYSETFTYETGKENFIGIVIPEMKDMDFIFNQTVSMEDVVYLDDSITFTIDRELNNGITEVYYMVNTKVIQNTVFTNGITSDSFVFTPGDLNIDIYDEGGIVPLEVVIAVKATDGSYYSKNITLNLKLENRK